MGEIKIKWDSVPKIAKHLLGASAVGGLKEHFSDPENQRRFAERQRERRKSKKNGR